MIVGKMAQFECALLPANERPHLEGPDYLKRGWLESENQFLLKHVANFSSKFLFGCSAGRVTRAMVEFQ